MVQMFHDIGGGDPLRLFVGVAEAVGAIGLIQVDAVLMENFIQKLAWRAVPPFAARV